MFMFGIRKFAEAATPMGLRKESLVSLSEINPCTMVADFFEDQIGGGRST